MIEVWKLSTSGIGLDKCTVHSYSDAAPFGALQSFRHAPVLRSDKRDLAFLPQAGNALSLSRAQPEQQGSDAAGCRRNRLASGQTRLPCGASVRRPLRSSGTERKKEWSETVP